MGSIAGRDGDQGQKLRSLISIYEGDSNKVGANTGHKSPLTATWYNNEARENAIATKDKTVPRDRIKSIAASAAHFLSSAAPVNEIGWTCSRSGSPRCG